MSSSTEVFVRAILDWATEAVSEFWDADTMRAGLFKLLAPMVGREAVMTSALCSALMAESISKTRYGNFVSSMSVAFGEVFPRNMGSELKKDPERFCNALVGALPSMFKSSGAETEPVESKQRKPAKSAKPALKLAAARTSAPDPIRALYAAEPRAHVAAHSVPAVSAALQSQFGRARALLGVEEDLEDPPDLDPEQVDAEEAAEPERGTRRADASVRLSLEQDTAVSTVVDLVNGVETPESIVNGWLLFVPQEKIVALRDRLNRIFVAVVRKIFAGLDASEVAVQQVLVTVTEAAVCEVVCTRNGDWSQTGRFMGGSTAAKLNRLFESSDKRARFSGQRSRGRGRGGYSRGRPYAYGHNDFTPPLPPPSPFGAPSGTAPGRGAPRGRGNF
jgi:hypothetical protein